MASPRFAVLPLLVAGTFFMEMLDGTVIATALPQMAVTFRVSPADLSIGMTAYLLTLAVFIPVSGWMAERFGARTVFGGAIALFTLASLLCGLSQTLLQFTLLRMLQGVGGAMMVPVGRLIVLRTTPKQDLLRAIQTITWPGLVATILGPPVGGFITTYASWRWIFYLNLPLGILALVLALRLVSDEHADAKRPFDAAGFALSAVALAGLMYGIDALGRSGTEWLLPLGIAVASVGIGILAIRHMRRHESPILDLAPSRIPGMAVNIWSGSLFRIAYNAIPFLMPLLLQVVFGLSAFASGLLLLAAAGGDVMMKTLVTRILRRFGFRTVLAANIAVGTLVLASFALFSPGTPHGVVAAVLVVYGLTRSLQFTAHNGLSFAAIPRELMAAASTLVSMLIQLTMGMGVAFGALMLHLAAWAHGRPDLPRLGDFRLCFLACAVVSITALVGYLRLAPEAGAVVSGHAPRRR